MGGWMPYRRVRLRNGLVDDELSELRTDRQKLITMDLDRMERDYLLPVYPRPPFATRLPGSDPTAVLARRSGVDEDTVRRVLREFFILNHDEGVDVDEVGE